MAMSMAMTRSTAEPRELFGKLTAMRRIAVLSLHTSPLAQPGTGDGGGMNVYVRELSTALARAGVACDVYTRRDRAELPFTVYVEPGFAVHHVDAGPASFVPKERLHEHVEEFTEGVIAHMTGAVALAWTRNEQHRTSRGGCERCARQLLVVGTGGSRDQAPPRSSPHLDLPHP